MSTFTRYRPYFVHDPAELDDEGCDSDGIYWPPNCEYRCNYRLLPVASLLELPDSPGHWEKVTDTGETSRWDVYFREWCGARYPFAANEHQSDPCACLTGRWRKLSDEYQGRLAR